MRLPLDCTVDYMSDFLNKNESQALYAALIDQYEIDKARLIKVAGGRLIRTDSFKILFLSDRLISINSHPEEIHGKSYPWKGKMLTLKNKIERFVNREFELAMCLYYPDGNYFAPYHSDQETSGPDTILPSISLGETRAFSFKENRSGVGYDLDLANGSLLVMGLNCQSRYTHSLLKEPKYKNGRINITFRESNFQ